MSNPLDPIMDWYRVVLDGLRVTSRVIDESTPNVITTRHTFFAETGPTSLDRIERAKLQLADLVVLGLVSTFERAVRDALASLPRVASAPAVSDSVDRLMKAQILADLEFWKLSEEVLAIFATRVDSDLIGQVKQAISFRNWVAHGRSAARPPKSDVNPQFAYRSLTAFLRQAGLL